MRISDWSSDVCSSDLVPAALKGNDDGQAFYGILDGTLVIKDGEPVAFEETADIALKIIEIIKARYIVHVWTNDVAQNNMRNGIDDYFFDVLRDQKGIELPSEVRSEEHTSELQSLMRISYAVF